jgi:hypothetical protein
MSERKSCFVADGEDDGASVAELSGWADGRARGCVRVGRAGWWGSSEVGVAATGFWSMGTADAVSGGAIGAGPSKGAPTRVAPMSGRCADGCWLEDWG